jgi:hypothetical protein
MKKTSAFAQHDNPHAPLGAPAPVSRNLDEVAQVFIDLHLDARVKRDLAIWFAEHPNRQFALHDLANALEHGRAAIAAGLKGLEESGAVERATGVGSHSWQLSTDVATRQVLNAVAVYFREHPEARTIIVRHAAV